MRGNNQRGKEGETEGEANKKIYPTQATEKKTQQNNKWATNTKRMAK